MQSLVAICSRSEPNRHMIVARQSLPAVAMDAASVARGMRASDVIAVLPGFPGMGARA
jgi:hypothetical protein